METYEQGSYRRIKKINDVIYKFLPIWFFLLGEICVNIQFSSGLKSDLKREPIDGNLLAVLLTFVLGY